MTDLANKPLVEVVFELRWEVRALGDSMVKRDPLTKLLFARLYERFTGRYPDYEELDASMMPDEVAAHVVQHRFTAKGPDADSIGMVQLGPGVLTLNVTSGYTWEAFYSELRDVLDDLFTVFPEDELSRFDSMELRYIDDIPADMHESKPLTFMREMMGCEVRLRDELFDGRVNPEARHVDLRLGMEVEGDCELDWRVVTAERARNDAPVLAWFTGVRKRIDGAVDGETILEWAQKAHDLQVHWFEKLTAGELYRSFK